MKQKRISTKKRSNIILGTIRNYTERGKFFNIKLSHNHSINELSILKSSVDPSSYPEIINELYKRPILTKLLGREKPLNELESEKLPFVDINSELLWAKSILKEHSSSILDFLKFSDSYSENLLLGNYQLCFEILDEIENEFGFSLWLIKNKISLIQLLKGLEEQKKYSQSIRASLKNGSLTNYVVYWVSIRNEEQTSANRFKTQIETYLNKLNSETQLGYKDYLQYHLLGITQSKLENFIHVLRLSYSNSLIDYYEAYVATIYNMTIDEKHIHKISNTFNYSNFLKGDYRLDFLNNLFFKQPLDLNSVSSEIYDRILTSHSDGIERYLDDMSFSVHNSPLNIILSSYIKSINHRNEDLLTDQKLLKEKIKFKDIVIDNLSKIISKGSNNATKEYNELSKIVLNFNSFNWVSSILLVLSQENNYLESSILGQQINVFRSAILHPYYLIFSSTILNYGNVVENLFENSISLSYHKSISNLVVSNDLININSDFIHYLNAIVSFNQKDYSNSLKYGELLKSSSDDYFIRRGYGFLSNSYLQLKDYTSTCQIISENLLTDKNHTNFLPLKDFSDSIESGTEEWNKLNHIIDFSIVLDWCVKSVNKNLEMNRRFAYEDFLIKNGFDKPSELRSFIGNFDVNKLIYYLRHICLESIMETSSVFEGGSKAVLEERLLICRILFEIDKDNENIHKLEIKELLRRQIISSRRQEVDQSRIYVDIQGIKEWAKVELNESYNRYLSYLRLDIRNNLNAELKVEKELYSKSDIETPIDEVFSLFKYIFEEIRSVYLSVDMGLDRFISTRIRHGELERTMRIPIQNHKLITKRSTKDGPYQPNIHWISEFKREQSLVNVDSIFNNFSKSYDELIFNIANEYLQIKKYNKQKGLFDFNFSDEDLKLITERITPDTPFEECISIIIYFLETRLILSLVSIRDFINNICKQNAKQLLNQLNEKISSQVNYSLIEFERALASARTDLSLQFDRIIEWFVPPTSGNSTPFVIEDAIAVAEEIIKEDNPNFIVKYLTEESSLQIHGQLPIFVDIFINIFENIVKRSGLEVPKGEIKIEEQELDQDVHFYTINISNEISNLIDIENLKSNLEAKKTLLDTGNYTEYLAKEGNSGLFKIHKSVTDFNLGGELYGKLHFGIIDHSFVISMNVPFRIISLETEK